jgi:hypothetical protein
MSDSSASLKEGFLLIAALVLGLLAEPLPAQAQTVRGRVLESQGVSPVVSAGVVLLDTTFVSVAGTATNANGAFTLEAPGPGAYYVLTEALGYSPSIDGILELSEGGSITVEIYLKPRPIVLDSIKVAVERAQIFQHLEKAGYNQRQAAGFGHFITPDEIKRRNPRTVEDLFRNAPGIRILHGEAETGNAGAGIVVRSATLHGQSAVIDLPGYCWPNVYVDGVLVSVDPKLGGVEGAVELDQIAAVEVYTRASNVPSQWGGTNAGCGVVLIWTR